MVPMTTPAEQYLAAKKRGSHPLTIKFIAQFDFGFDEFDGQRMVTSLLRRYILLRRRCHRVHVSPADAIHSAETGARPMRSPSAYATASAVIEIF